MTISYQNCIHSYSTLMAPNETDGIENNGNNGSHMTYVIKLSRDMRYTHSIHIGSEMNFHFIRYL